MWTDTATQTKDDGRTLVLIELNMASFYEKISLNRTPQNNTNLVNAHVENKFAKEFPTLDGKQTIFHFLKKVNKRGHEDVVLTCCGWQ